MTSLDVKSSSVLKTAILSEGILDYHRGFESSERKIKTSKNTAIDGYVYILLAVRF